MDTSLLRIFQLQIRDQCTFLLFAAQELEDAMRDLNASEQGFDSASRTEIFDRIFYAIQNLLNAGANISKILWGQKGRFSKERQRLRESIGVSDESQLRQVTMRNHFEHMDERIDRWWVESPNKNHIDKHIGSIRGFEGSNSKDVFRMFNPDTAEVIFWSEKFNIQNLVTEAKAILPKAETEWMKPHWE